MRGGNGMKWNETENSDNIDPRNVQVFFFFSKFKSVISEIIRNLYNDTIKHVISISHIMKLLTLGEESEEEGI